MDTIKVAKVLGKLAQSKATLPPLRGIVVGPDWASAYDLEVFASVGSVPTRYVGGRCVDPKALAPGVTPAELCPTEDLPFPPAFDCNRTRVVETDILRAAIDYVAPAVSTDWTRYNLCGVYLDPDGSIVATDGHRLHLVSKALADGPGLIIPPRAFSVALALAKLHRDRELLIEWGARVGQGSPSIQIRPVGDSPAWRVQAKAIDGDYPAYWNAIPAPLFAAPPIRLEACDLHGAAKTAGKVIDWADLVPDPDAPTITIRAKGDKGACAVQVTVYSTDAIPTRPAIRLDPRYLREACDLDGTIAIGWSDELSPWIATGRVGGCESLALVMPQRR